MNDKHYNPAIAARLRIFVDGRQWLSITTYLDTLSHAQFRTAGYMLKEVFMPRLEPDDFWLLASVLVNYNPKAFLVTILKSWVSQQSTVLLPFTQTTDVSTPISSMPSVASQPSLAFFQSLRNKEEDVRKTLQVLLPVLSSPSGIETLLQVMGVTDPQSRIKAYLNHLTPATAYLLVRVLHEVEDDRSLLIRIVHHLMKQGGNLSFNLASFLCTLHGLEEVKGTFSLRLRPFELSYILGDFEAFCKVMRI